MNAGDDMPVRALTNSSYRDLLDGLSDDSGFGGMVPLPSQATSSNPNNEERFALAASASQRQEPVSLADGFAALAAVEDSETRWQIVVQPSEGVVMFRLAGSEQQWRIDTNAIDYSCMSVPLAQSLDHLLVSGADVQFRALEGDQLANTVSEVLDGFSDTIELPSEMAWPIAEAQLNARTCMD